jgi:hypothetical protein
MQYITTIMNTKAMQTQYVYHIHHETIKDKTRYITYIRRRLKSFNYLLQECFKFFVYSIIIWGVGESVVQFTLQWASVPMPAVLWNFWSPKIIVNNWLRKYIKVSCLVQFYPCLQLKILPLRLSENSAFAISLPSCWHYRVRNTFDLMSRLLYCNYNSSTLLRRSY